MGQSRHNSASSVPPAAPTGPVKLRRRRRWLFLLLLAVLVAVVLGYQHLTSPQRVAALAQRSIQSVLGGKVRITSAHFSLDGTITLHELEVTVPDLPAGGDRLFSCAQVVIDYSPWGLLRGGIDARRVVFQRPTLFLCENLDTDRFNFQTLQEQRLAAGSRSPASRRQRLPDLFINDGLVVFGQLRGGIYKSQGVTSFAAQLTADPASPDDYSFALTQITPRPHEGKVLTGRFDLDTLGFSAKVENFAFTHLDRMLMPSAVANWWDRLRPEGALPAIRFGYEPRSGFQAEVQLRDLSVNLPLRDYPARATLASGRLLFQNRRLQFDDLAGTIEGFRYRVRGSIDDLAGEPAFDLDLHVEGAIPANPPYLAALPPQVLVLHRRFKPVGNVAAHVRLKQIAGSELAFTGYARLIDAQARYIKFPYPVEHIHGRINFDNQRLTLDLAGKTPSGGPATLIGIVEPPSDDGRMDLTITARHAPIDATLYDALPVAEGKIVAEFLSRDHYVRLVRMGLIAPTKSPDQLRDMPPMPELADALAHARAATPATQPAVTPVTPVPFDLGGAFDMTIHVLRPPGPHRDYQTNVDLNLAGARLLCDAWAYPATVVSGRAVVQPPTVELRDFVLQSPTGAHATLHGKLESDDQDRTARHLRLKVDQLPVDALLLASLPDDVSDEARRLKLAGLLAIDGQITNAPGDRPLIDFAWTLQQGSLQPAGPTLKLTDVAAQGSMRKTLLTIDHLAARINDATLTLKGALERDPLAPTTELHLHAKGLTFNDPLLEMAGMDSPQTAATLAKLLDAHQPQGVFDAALSLTPAGPDQAAGMVLAVSPHRLAFNYRGQRIDATECSGQIVLTPGQAELRQMHARIGAGQATLTGAVTLEDNPAVELAIEATDTGLTPVVRTILPPGVLSVIDALQVDGQYTVHDARLRITPRPDMPGEADVNFRGAIDLRDAHASLGVPITKLAGTLRIAADQPAGQTWPKLDLGLNADTVRAAGRRLDNLTLRIASTDDRQNLTVSDVHALCYGGKFLGAGVITLGDAGRYTMSMKLVDVAMDPFVHLDREHRWIAATQRSPDAQRLAPDPDLPTGVLSARLDIDGPLAQGDRRRGRGELLIRNARLFELPLAMSILQLLNFTIPGSAAFDSVTARYLLEGDLVRFDLVRFDAPKLTIAGEGSMTLPAMELDLDLASRNPNAINLGAFSDLLEMARRQLVAIKVTGPLDNPRTQVQSLTGVRRSWNEIFFRKDAPGIAPSASPAPAP